MNRWRFKDSILPTLLDLLVTAFFWIGRLFYLMQLSAKIEHLTFLKIRYKNVFKHLKSDAYIIR